MLASIRDLVSQLWYARVIKVCDVSEFSEFSESSERCAVPGTSIDMCVSVVSGKIRFHDNCT
jgi:hypothetical protein